MPVEDFKEPPISAIILNYNAKIFLTDCITSIIKSTYPEIEIILVDNASTDGSLDLLSKEFGSVKNLRIIKNKTNLGFNEGNNIGFANSSGEYCLFVNPDVKITDPTTIEKLAQVLSTHKDIGIIAPVILDYDSNTVQSAGVYLSFRAFEFGKGECYEDFLRKNLQPYFVAFTPGAFVMIKRELVKGMILFDKSFFMQGDIDDLCLRAWKKGYRVMVLPSVTVMHYEGGSVKQYYKTNYQRLLRGYYHGIRADLAVTFKNFESSNAIKMISRSLLVYLFETFFLSLKFRNSYPLLAYVKALFWDIKNFNNIYAKKLFVKKNYLTKDKVFMDVISKNSSFSDYLRRFKVFRS